MYYFFNSAVAGTIQEHDEPALEHLLDIRSQERIDGFQLNFIFGANPYFTNRTLSKTYYMKNTYASDCIQYKGVEIYRTEGTPIQWKSDDANLTRHEAPVQQIRPTTNETRTVRKVVDRESFFRFFTPPCNQMTNRYEDEANAELLEHDFEIGELFHDDVIRHAALIYFGVHGDDEEPEEEDVSMYDEEGDVEEDDLSDDEEVDDDEEEEDESDEGEHSTNLNGSIQV